jgi:hypothetical protein
MIFQTDLELQNHVRKLINELNFSVSYEDIRKIVEIINYIGTIKIVELYDIFFDFLKPDNFENKQEFSKFLDGIYHELITPLNITFNPIDSYFLASDVIDKYTNLARLRKDSAKIIQDKFRKRISLKKEKAKNISDLIRTSEGFIKRKYSPENMKDTFEEWVESDKPFFSFGKKRKKGKKSDYCRELDKSRELEYLLKLK